MAESSFHREAFISEDENIGNCRLELLVSFKTIFKCWLHCYVVTKRFTSILLGISVCSTNSAGHIPSNTTNLIHIIRDCPTVYVTLDHKTSHKGLFFFFKLRFIHHLKAE